MNNSESWQLATGVIGALLGALLGSLGTYFIGENARKKQLELDEKKVIRQRIRNHTKAVSEADNYLYRGLVMVLKNIELLQDIQKGVVDETTHKFRATMSLPQPYGALPEISADISNIKMALHWSSLEVEIALQNTNLREFTEYYTHLRTTVHDSFLAGDNPNSEVIRVDNDSIMQGAKDIIEASEHFKERCMGILALIRLHAESLSKKDYTKITLVEAQEYFQGIIDYVPKDKDFKAKVADLKKEYTAKNAFKFAGFDNV